jgi:hypothetical protein
MDQCIDQQSQAAQSLSDARMVDADGGIAAAAHRGSEQNIPASLLERAKIRLEFDQAIGWPPKLARASERQCLPAARAIKLFDLQAQRDCLDVALRHQEVRSYLVGRWETLNVHLEARRDTPCNVELHAKVSFYNYTSNRLVEVCLQDGVVTVVNIGKSYQHPEASIEMAHAIALARAHPEIRDQVASLTAHAILSVPMDPTSSNYLHRCLLVMFTDKDDAYRELPVLFSALVDLCEQRVVASGTCPCNFDAKKGHQCLPTISVKTSECKETGHGRA